MSLVLHGYRYSVYTRIARVVLAEKGVPYGQREVNPFENPVPADFLEMNPFRRVPVLVHADFSLYETTAIARYINAAFPGPDFVPLDARAAAGMAQIISIVDSYAYTPMVREVFSQRVFMPRLGFDCDDAVVHHGLEKAARVLNALERIAAGGDQLNGTDITLADFHLGPMMAYFTMDPDGHAMLSQHARLARWWDHIRSRESFRNTDPGLPGDRP